MRVTTHSIVLAAVLAALTFAATAHAQHAQWGELKPGPFTVGFRAVHAVDQSRNFASRFDVDGNPAPASVSRRIPIYMWYPARAESGDPMPYWQYRVSSAGPEATDALAEAMIEGERQLIGRMTGQSFSTVKWTEIMQTPTAAHLEAEPIKGRFPVILSCTDPTRNSVLFEYLASHGYIVATVPTKGRFTAQALEFTPNPASIETSVQDLQFAYGFLHNVPGADLDRLGLWMFSSLSIYSLEFQARNMAAKALLHVEGWEAFTRGREILKGSTFFDPAAVRVPYMLVRKVKEESSPQYATDMHVFESLIYSNRYRVSVSGMNHGDFNSQTVAAYATPAVRGQFDRVAELTLAFFDTHVDDSADGRERLEHVLSHGEDNGFMESETHAAVLAPPTLAEFIADMGAGGERMAFALGRVNRVLNEGGQLPYSEAILNRFGYRLMRTLPSNAPPLFELMTRIYPASANSWASLADAWEAVGSPAKAVEAAKQALSLIDKDASLSEERAARLHESLRAMLSRLQ